MNGQRLTLAAMERLETQLSSRDSDILAGLAQVRVLTGTQLTRLYFADLSPLTQDRVRRRVLERLTALSVVARLERRIGGVRAGSSGWIYSLGAAGQKLLRLRASDASLTRVRQPWTPGQLFLEHSLDVAEVFVQLTLECRTDAALRLSNFQTEPACWWPDGLGGFLKPDAFLVCSTATYDELLWLEVDRSTESLPTLRRKILTYQQFHNRGQLGPGGVTPHLLFTTRTAARANDIRRIYDSLQLPVNGYHVTPFEDACHAILRLTASNPPPYCQSREEISHDNSASDHAKE